MQAEVTRVFPPQQRLNHVGEVALSGGLEEALFDTKDYGTVEITRGQGERAGSFLARSEAFNVSVIIDKVGDQAAIVTYGFLAILITNECQEKDLRENVDLMLQQCNNVTRRS